ncbi:MAG: hypothetical protein ACM3NQ_25640 [Bacteroidales bacterium]
MPRRVGVFVALLMGLLGGWLWGASGRAHQDRAVHVAEVCNDLLEARTSLLAARVDLDDADVGRMSRHLAAAREFADRARVRLENLGWRDEPQRVELAGIAADIAAAARLGARLVREAPTRGREPTTAVDEIVRNPSRSVDVERRTSTSTRKVDGGDAAQSNVTVHGNHR